MYTHLLWRKIHFFSKINSIFFDLGISPKYKLLTGFQIKRFDVKLKDPYVFGWHMK